MTWCEYARIFRKYILTTFKCTRPRTLDEEVAPKSISPLILKRTKKKKEKKAYLGQKHFNFLQINLPLHFLLNHNSLSPSTAPLRSPIPNRACLCLNSCIFSDWSISYVRASLPEICRYVLIFDWYKRRLVTSTTLLALGIFRVGGDFLEIPCNHMY